MKETISFTKETYRSENELIVYGASVYGELAYYTLEALGITPDYYCDRANETGEYFGIKVIRPEELASHKDASLIIASSDYFVEIKKFLQKIEIKHIFDMESLLNVDIDPRVLSARAADFYDKKQDYIDIVNAIDLDDMPSFPRIQFVVTSACSLRCKDCISLMQYYEKPENSKLELYKKGFDRLLDNVSNIFDLRILGGEPFVNQEVYKIIEWYHDNSKVGMISIFTNGTIIPNDKTIEQLKKNKVRVHISDYKFNRDKISKLVEVLRQNNIRYYVQPYDYWQDAGNLIKRDYSEDALIKMFGNCYERECFSYFNGRLFHCPRAAHGVELGVMQDLQEEYVNLMDEKLSDYEIKCKLIEQREKQYIDACRYCDGADSRKLRVEPAIQISKPKSIYQ